MKTFYISCRGLNFFIRTLGDPDHEPVVFLHGISMSGAVWSCAMEYLSKKFYTVAIDFRGHGKSDKPINASYIFDEHADDVYCILNKLNIKLPNMVGWSLGGLVAQVYAVRYSNHLKSLSLVDTGPQGNATPNFPWAIPADKVNVVVNLLNLTVNALNSNNQKQAYNYYQQFALQLHNLNLNDTCDDKLGLQDLKQKLMDITLQSSPYAILASFNQNGNTSLINQLPLIKVPTLIIVGSIDQFYPVQAAEFMRDRIKDSIIVEFANKGHSAALTDSVRFNLTLEAFLTGVDKKCTICKSITP